MDSQIFVNSDVQNLINTPYLSVSQVCNEKRAFLVFECHNSETNQERTKFAALEHQRLVSILFISVDVCHKSDFNLPSIIIDSRYCLRNL